MENWIDEKIELKDKEQQQKKSADLYDYTSNLKRMPKICFLVSNKWKNKTSARARDRKR